jgi:hypothetical protein
MGSFRMVEPQEAVERALEVWESGGVLPPERQPPALMKDGFLE